MLTQEQVAKRKESIGSSDIGTICGFNEFKTAVELWQEKITGVKFSQGSVQTEVGHAAEDIVAALYEKRTGTKLVRYMENDGQHIDSEKPYFTCRVDYLSEDGSFIVECKTVNWAEYNSPRWENGLPMKYFCQVQWQMSVSGIKSAKVALLIFSSFGQIEDFQIFDIQYNNDFVAAIRDLADNFWQKNVMNKVAPEPVTVEDYRIVYPDSKPKSIVLADTAIEEIHERMKQIQAQKSPLEKEYEDLKGRIIAFAQDNEAVLTHEGRTLFTYKTSKRKYFNQQALEQAEPETYAKYVEEKSVRSLLVK